MLFGQFVGDWEIQECRLLGTDGTWKHLRGELHWRWILRGRAVQDVWTLYDRATGELVYEGTTVRLYVPATGAWTSTWISTGRAAARRFVGRLVGHEIVLDELAETGAPEERWTFFDITHDSFRWRSEERPTPNSNWRRTEEMRIQRVR